MTALNSINNGYFNTNVNGWDPSSDTCYSGAYSWSDGRMRIDNPWQVGCTVQQYVGARQTFMLKSPILRFDISCYGPTFNLAYWVIKNITTSTTLFSNKGGVAGCVEPKHVDIDVTSMGATIGDLIEIEFGQRYAHSFLEIYIDNVENLYEVNPASIESTLLTVDKNNCDEYCTINGVVNWINSGDLASDPTDLGIIVNGVLTVLESAVIINPGETKSYNFTLPDLAAKTYTIEASPNTGTIPQVVIVNEIAKNTDLSGLLLLGLTAGAFYLFLFGGCGINTSRKSCEKARCIWEKNKCRQP